MSSSTSTLGSSTRRILSLAAAFAMIFALLPASAIASSGEARDLDGGICDDPDSSFPDIASDRIDRAAGCLADFGIALGFTDGTYRPGILITREQMASFLARTLQAADDYDEPVASPPAAYGDRAQIADAHIANVDMVSDPQTGPIAEGYDDGNFGPGDPVLRAQMAAFIVRLIEEMTGEEMDEPAENWFNDSDVWAEEYIEKLHEAGIAEGVGDRTFSPHTNVTRGQMALFMARTLDYLVEEHDFTFTPITDPDEPVEGNQTFAVTPGDRATNESGDSRAYTADVGDAARVDIGLYVCANVNVDENDVVTFTPNNPAATGNNRWAATGTISDASISVVNGVATTGDPTHVNNVTPVNGSVSFTIVGDDTECVRPVVWADTVPAPNGDNNLQIDADNEPVEDFGVGGEKQWIPGEAAAGAFSGTVTFVDKDLDLFVLDTNNDGTGDSTFYYETGDVYQIKIPTGGTCTNTTQANWENNLSVNDDMEGEYSPDATSRFCLDDVAPAAPTNADANATLNQVTVTWDDPNTPDADSYNVYRAPGDAANADADCDNATLVPAASYSQVATTTQSQYQETVADGDYCYKITAVQDGDESARSDGAYVEVPGPGDTTRPTSEDIELRTDAGFEGVMDAGDVFWIGFSETMSAPDAGDTIRVEDGDGTVADVICGTNATCTLSTQSRTVNATAYAAGEVIEVTMTAAPSVVTAGTTAGVQYPAEVINSSGFTDPSGNTWNVGASSDTTIE